MIGELLYLTYYYRSVDYFRIDCKFCGKKVQKGSELRHFKYLNSEWWERYIFRVYIISDFLEEFGDEQICNEGCELRHSEKNCEYIVNKFILNWRIVKSKSF